MFFDNNLHESTLKIFYYEFIKMHVLKREKSQQCMDHSYHFSIKKNNNNKEKSCLLIIGSYKIPLELGITFWHFINVDFDNV